MEEVPRKKRQAVPFVQRFEVRGSDEFKVHMHSIFLFAPHRALAESYRLIRIDTHCPNAARFRQALTESLRLAVCAAAREVASTGAIPYFLDQWQWAGAEGYVRLPVIAGCEADAACAAPRPRRGATRSSSQCASRHASSMWISSPPRFARCAGS
jgi:hypothetical protein